jgi:multiple sugar transport system ATP-binding protein
MEIVDAGQGLATEVEVVEELGADAYVYGSADLGGTRHSIIARVGGRAAPQKGAVLHLAPADAHVHVFAGDTGERIEL